MMLQNINQKWDLLLPPPPQQFQIIRYCGRNRFVKSKLLPIFKTNVFELYVYRQVKTVLKIFPDIQYLAYLQLIFTSVINLFKNIPLPDFSILAMFLYF